MKKIINNKIFKKVLKILSISLNIFALMVIFLYSIAACHDEATPEYLFALAHMRSSEKSYALVEDGIYIAESNQHLELFSEIESKYNCRYSEQMGRMYIFKTNDGNTILTHSIPRWLYEEYQIEVVETDD